MFRPRGSSPSGPLKMDRVEEWERYRRSEALPKQHEEYRPRRAHRQKVADLSGTDCLPTDPLGLFRRTKSLDIKPYECCLERRIGVQEKFVP